MNLRTTAFACALAAGSVAAAQSASVSLVAPGGASVAAGDTVAVEIVADFDVSSVSGGVFGDPGLYGFGGDVASSGSLAGAAASDVVVNGDLTFGFTAGTTSGADISRVGAGVGLGTALDGSSAVLATFDVDIPAGAADGDTLTLDYTGAVILVAGDRLQTFSTDPGVNQDTLPTTGLTLTVGAGVGFAGCNSADTEQDGDNDILDVLELLSSFDPADPNCTGPGGIVPCNSADTELDGDNDILDVLELLNSFNPDDPACTG